MDWSEEAILELWNERAAIREFDGGLNRTAAERAAYFDLKRLVPGTFVVPDVLRKMMDATAEKSNR